MAVEGYFGEGAVKPSFNSGENSKKRLDFADPNANLLRQAESSATRELNSNPEDLNTLENEPRQGFYTGRGSDGLTRGDALRDPTTLSRSARAGWPNNAKQSSNAWGKRTTIFNKRSLPLAVSLLLFGGAGFAIMSSNSLLGPHISALTTNVTNVGRTAVTKVENSILTYLSNKNMLPTSLQKRFVRNGATAATASSVEFKGKTLTGSEIVKTAQSDIEFGDTVNNSTRSNVLDFHDTSANQTYDHLSQSRNIFNDYKVTGDEKTDDANYAKLREAAAGGEVSNVKINTAEDEQRTNPETGEVEVDEDGNPIIDRKPTGSDVSATSANGADAKTKAEAFISGTAAKVASGVNVACAGWQVGNMISMAVSAAELYQSINYFHNTIESISKMMAGEGDESGINQVLNFFATPTTQKVYNPMNGEEIETTGSPLQSEWARTVLGGVTANSNNSALYSFERLSRTSLSVFGSFLTNKRAAAACNISRAAAAAISLGSIATGGIIGTMVGALLNTALRIGITVAISGALAAFIPVVAKALFTNTFKEYESGIPAGEEFGRGAMAANSRISRSASGLMPASAENSVAYQKMQTQTLAAEAELDRYRRSPFDATSPNTFLGSILTKFAFVPLFNSKSLIANITSGNLYSIASTLANATTSSLYKNVSADGDYDTYLTTYGECPNLTDIDTVGEMYCNALLAADPSILDLNPEDATYRSVVNKSLEIDENGNEKIIDNSPLAEFITYGADRDSAFGVYDANIAKACESSLGIVGDNLPILNDVIDIVNAVENASCERIATGEKYTYSASNPDWDREIKYYQAYMLQNRVLDRFGYYEELGVENPVVAYREHYLEEHPLDNSRAGILARISGLEKSDAEMVLALADYYQALEDYHPEDTYAFNSENREASSLAMIYTKTSQNSQAFNQKLDFSTSYAEFSTTPKHFYLSRRLLEGVSA